MRSEANEVVIAIVTGARSAPRSARARLENESADAMSHHGAHGSLARDDKNRTVPVA